MVLTVQHFPLTFTLYSFEYQVGEGEGGGVGVLEISFARYVSLLRAPTPL